jgi:hypothetical protein
METTRSGWTVAACALAAMLTGAVATAGDSETAFVYEGRLTDGLEAATGAHDFRFRLYDAAEDGALIGEPVSKDGVEVRGGLFQVELDFGHDLFTGEACCLEIAVRAAGDGSDFVSLSPRQAFIPVPSAWKFPYAIYAPEVRSCAEDSQAAVTAVGFRETEGGEKIPLISPTGDHTYGTGDYSILHQGEDCSANGDYSAVGGGKENEAGGTYATVSGGYHNIANGYDGSIGGGAYNTAKALNSRVGGGNANDAEGNFSTIAGGQSNKVDKTYAAIAGGYLNRANGDAAAVGGGRYNEASGLYAAIPGG